MQKIDGCHHKKKLKMNSLRSAASAFALLGAFVAVGCQSSPPTAIDLVKNGVLRIEKDNNGTTKNHDSTAVGRAFEGTFQHTKWTSFEVGHLGLKNLLIEKPNPYEKHSPSKATVVEFRGTIERTVLSNAGFDVGAEYRMRCMDEATKIEQAKLEWPSDADHPGRLDLYRFLIQQSNLRKVVDQTKTFKSCYDKTSHVSVVPVIFQFIVASDPFSTTFDQKAFTLSAWDWEPWRRDGPVSENRNDEAAVLSLIYH
jgi:hypothetical protein